MIDGRPHLCAAIGSHEYVEGVWVPKSSSISDIAKSQPQAAFSALKDHILAQDREYCYIINNQLLNKANVSKDNKRSADNCQTGSRRPWIWQRWKELPLGSLFYPSYSTTSHYISLPFKMLWPCGKAGHNPVCVQNVNVHGNRACTLLCKGWFSIS